MVPYIKLHQTTPKSSLSRDVYGVGVQFAEMKSERSYHCDIAILRKADRKTFQWKNIALFQAASSSVAKDCGGNT
jgi:hypothetical protein